VFEDVTDPDRDSVTNKPWWSWAPVDADEAKRDVLGGCGYGFLVIGLFLWGRWPRLDQLQIALYVLALLLLVAIALTRSQVLVVALAAETAVLAWAVGMPRAGESLRVPIFYFSLPVLSVFWLGTRCSAYHRFRAAEKQPGPDGETVDAGSIHPE